MDFFPNLGEPGILDDLFWFGPLVLQLVLGGVFYWLSGKFHETEATGTRIVSTIGMVIAADFLLFIAAGVVFNVANPSLL